MTATCKGAPSRATRKTAFWTGVAASDELVIAEAGEGVDLRDGAAVGIAAELGEADGAVGGDAGDAAIFKLDFDAAVVAGDKAHAFDDGHVGLCLIEGDVSALKDLDLTLDGAEADGADLALALSFRGRSGLGVGRRRRRSGVLRMRHTSGNEESQGS
jgi:hypothetical protein